MSFIMRLWWKLTLSPPDYHVRCQDQQVVKDLNRLCQFFGLSLKSTTIWHSYDVPYHPTRSYDKVDYLLESALKTSFNAHRRMCLYTVMKMTQDITPNHIRQLLVTGGGDDFYKWLKGK